MNYSVPDNSDYLRLSSGPLQKMAGANNLAAEYENDEDDDGPPALQMSSEELAALQSRFRLECDVNSDSDESSDEGHSLQSNRIFFNKVKQNNPKSATPSGSVPHTRPHDESSCFPTDSMILENKTLYENMLQEDPNNLTNVDKWQAINRPKYISRPEGWTAARPNDLVQMTPEEYLALGSEPIGLLGDAKNITAFEMAGLLPSMSPASSVSPNNIAETNPSPKQPPENSAKITAELKPPEVVATDESVNIDYLLQPTDPAAETTLDRTAVSTVSPKNSAGVKEPSVAVSNSSKKPELPLITVQPDSGRDTDKHSPVSETQSSQSNSGSGSVSFCFNNGSAIADVTDPDLAAVDAMLEMYDTDVDPEQLAEHIMMRFGVNPQRPGSSSGAFRDQDESMLRLPRTALSLASVISSTPKAPLFNGKNGSRPASAQSSASRKIDTSSSSSQHVTLENVCYGGRASADSSSMNEKRISTQSAASSTSTIKNDGFVKPAAPAGNENAGNKASPNLLSAPSNVSLLSSFDVSGISDYGPVLTPVAEKGPFIRLEWDKLAIDLKEPVFVGQSHDITLTARNTGRLWVQLSATLQNAKIDGKVVTSSQGLHILNSTLVIEPSATGAFRLRFVPGDPGFYSANVELYACVVGSVVDESRSLPPIPFAADVRLPNVVFDVAGQPICDFGALPAGANRRVVSTLRLEPPSGLGPGSATFNTDIPVAVTIRPESAWRCFHLLPSTAETKPGQASLFSTGHATKMYLSAIHKQHDFLVSFTARYDTEISPNQQGLDLNEAELIAQTDSTPPLKLASMLLRAAVGLISIKPVGLDESTDESTTLRMSSDGGVTNRTFFLVNAGSIGVDVSTEITSSPTSGEVSAGANLFSVQPSHFTLLPKQKMQMNVKFDPASLGPGEMCAGFLSFYTDPPQSGGPGQLPALDVSLIGLMSQRSAEVVPRQLPSSLPSSANTTPRSEYAVLPSDSRQNSAVRPIGSIASESDSGSSGSSGSNRRSLVTSHQRVVWWGIDAGQAVEQIVNLRNVGSDEVSVRISIRDNDATGLEPSFTLGGSPSTVAPLLATLPPASDFPVRIIFQAQQRHQYKTAVAKLQIKVLASGANSVAPGLKFCIPLFGAVGTVAMDATGASLRTTSAGHYYAIIGTVPTGATRTMKLTLRNRGLRNAFFAALPFADMSCTQRLSLSKVGVSPSKAVIPAGDSIEVTAELHVADREAALCAERSYIVACLQIVFGDNDLRLLAGRAKRSVKEAELRKVLDETGRELIESPIGSDREPREEAWPEHLRLFSRHCRRLYIALVGERTSATESNGGSDFDEETLQHTILLDDTQATIMMPPPSNGHDRVPGSISSLVEMRSNTRAPVAVAPSLATVNGSPYNGGRDSNGIRLLPSELLLTALSDSRTLMLINDTSSPTTFEVDWPVHVLNVEPAKGTLPSNGTATLHVGLVSGAVAFVDPTQQQWVGQVGVRTSFGQRLDTAVRIHLSSSQSTMPPPSSVPRGRHMRHEPVVQVVFGARDCPYPPAARLDFGQIPISNESPQRKLSLRLENEQPFVINWKIEELSAYALASLSGSGAQYPVNSGSTSRCIPSIFSFSPCKGGSLPANGGQILLKCLFQVPPTMQQQQDVNYLQHFLLTVKGTTGWTAETRISAVASLVTNLTTAGENASAFSTTNLSMNTADQSHLSRVSNSSVCSAAPLSASRYPRMSTSRFLVCPGEKHEFKKVVRPGETAKEKVNLENRSSSQILYVEIASGPSLPFSTKHRRFSIEPMHYLHLPVVFKPGAPGSFHSEMTLHASTTPPPNSAIPEEVLTVSLLAQAGV